MKKLAKTVEEYIRSASSHKLKEQVASHLSTLRSALEKGEGKGAGIGPLGKVIVEAQDLPRNVVKAELVS